MRGYLEVDIAREQGDEGALRIEQELVGLQVPGVQVTSVSDWPVIVNLEAQTSFQLSEAARKVERMSGVARVLLYLGKEALAINLEQPGVGK